VSITITLRKWQAEAVKRSDHLSNGIFLEALGGRGKTICALAIAKHKKAKKIIITNNRLAILNGWIEAVRFMNFDEDVEIIIQTDRYLRSNIHIPLYPHQ